MPPGQAPEDPVATLCAVAEAFGVASLRAPLLALRAARLIAAAAGRAEPDEADLIEAAGFVLAPRATRLPAPPQPDGDAAEDPPPPEPHPPRDSHSAPEDKAERNESTAQAPDETVLEAVRAALPKNLLAQLLAGGPPLRATAAGRMGAASASPLLGRPVQQTRGR